MTRQPPEDRPGRPFRTRSGWRQYILLGVILALILAAALIWVRSANAPRADDDGVVGAASFSAYVEVLRVSATDGDTEAVRSLLWDSATVADAAAFIADQGDAEKKADYRMTEHDGSATVAFRSQLTGDELPSFEVEWTGTRWSVEK